MVTTVILTRIELNVKTLLRCSLILWVVELDIPIAMSELSNDYGNWCMIKAM